MNEKQSPIKINKNSTPYLIVLSLILGVGLGAVVTSVFKSPFSTLSSSSTATQTTSTDLNNIDNSFFNQVTKTIEDNYIGDVPDTKNLTYGAIKGVLDSLGNKYNSFLTPEEATKYLDSRNPTLEGIGVTLRYNGENTEVETVLTGYPAEKAGIKTGDVLMEVDGESVSGQLPNIVAPKIRGTAGSSVKIKVLRSSDSAGVLEFNVQRETITVDNITYKDLGNGIYQISIGQFLDTTSDEFNKKWDDIVTQVVAKGNVKGIILDLRNNPGGYVFSVRHVLEEFLSNGKLMMSEELKDKPKTDFTDARTGKFENTPLEVLVNEGSASASEIFATSIQDNGRGKVVGKKTIGKGVEQQVMTLDDNSMLILVFQKWLTPSGRNITPDDPVTPDFDVDYTQDNVKAGVDPQLNKAKELLTQSN